MLKKLKLLLQTEIDPAFAKRAQLIFEEIYKNKPKKVLDVGCGRGFYLQALKYLRFINEIHGVDINPAYLSIAKNGEKDKRVYIKEASIYKLPYPNGYFDFIICSEILEHLKDDVKGLKELKRVLKPTGIIVITVPNNFFPFLWDPLNWILMRSFNTHVPKRIWWLAGIWADHERLYTKERLIKLTKQLVFTVKEVKLIVHYCWPFSHFLLYGVGKNIIERYGVKKFNRFYLKNKKASLLASIFKFPSTFDKEYHKTYMNICITVQK